MKISILGAGSVGLALGARLARSGSEVRFAVRSREVADAITSRGIELTDPATHETWHAPASAILIGPDEPAKLAGPVLLCTRVPDLAGAVAVLESANPDSTVVSVQNDVGNEELLARRFSRVLGLVVRHTCTRSGQNSVRALGGGRLVLGAHPEGGGSDVETLASAFRAGGFDVAISHRIAEDRWLKLCMNLMSTPNALVRPADHATRAFVETKARLLEEARSALAAAGIVARSCDGRDHSIDEEIAAQRASLARRSSARPLALYNAVWGALSGRGPLEADRYHEQILSLASAHRLEAPCNRRALVLLRRAVDAALGPECYSAEEFLPSP